MGLPYGDPEELERLAKALVEHAAAVRQATADQLRRTREARWVSDSALKYQELLVQKCQAAGRSADGIEAAAAAFRAHAQQIRELLAAIDRIERTVTEWFSAAARKLEEVVAAGGALASPPWLGWRYQPRTLPPPGDKGWLDVGRFMRRMGVF